MDKQLDRAASATWTCNAMILKYYRLQYDKYNQLYKHIFFGYIVIEL